ncbi:MAG: hypothetical protein JJ896_01470 [Rhodothermales bacterium]|nr:hypothetical protein [Rhodothermales bacterium]MBO6778298.1 hypothetical protein [Rhodothermales bacterium]
MKSALWVLLLLPGVVRAQVPAWAAEELSRVVGVWEADNSAYVSETEPDLAYRQEWRAGPGGHSATGRLYGMLHGEETGEYWQFRLFWDPGTERLRLMQWSASGIVGDGLFTQTGPDRNEVLQTFTSQDGTSWMQGHRNRNESDDQHIGTSYGVSEDGAWTRERTYTWRRIR